MCLHPSVCLLVCQPTFRYEESRVVEVRESVAVVAFSVSFLVALLADYESCEGAIHGVIGHLAWRGDRSRNRESMRSAGFDPEYSLDVSFMRFSVIQTLNHLQV